MKRETITALAALVAVLAITFVAGYYVATKSQRTVACDTTTYVDTIPYYKPVPKDSTVIKYVTRILPVVKPQGSGTALPADTLLAENYAQNNGENIPPLYASVDSDSAAVAIPITQKRYEGDDYCAYVSGYEPHLDSIFVFPKTTVIRERSYKPPNKWHIGITGGYGYGIKSKQVEPYIGIGLTYRIIGF